MGLEISLLGSPTVRRDGVPVAPPRGHKAWALLAYLVLSEAPVSRTRAAALLFPDAHDPLAALRWNLHELRRLLGAESGLRGDPITVHLAPTDVLDVAVVRSGSWRQAVLIAEPWRGAVAGAELRRLSRVRGVADRRAPAPAQRRRSRPARVRAGAADGRADRPGRRDRGPTGRGEPVRRGAAGALRALPARRRRPGRRAPAAAGGDRPHPARSRRGAGPGPADRVPERRRRRRGRRRGQHQGVVHTSAWSGCTPARTTPALASMRRAITAARRRGDRRSLLRALLICGYGLGVSSLGGGAESATVQHEAMALAAQLGDRARASAVAELQYATTELLRGQYSRAVHWADVASDAVRRRPGQGGAGAHHPRHRDGRHRSLRRRHRGAGEGAEQRAGRRRPPQRGVRAFHAGQGSSAAWRHGRRRRSAGSGDPPRPGALDRVPAVARVAARRGGAALRAAGAGGADVPAGVRAGPKLRAQPVLGKRGGPRTGPGGRRHTAPWTGR